MPSSLRFPLASAHAAEPPEHPSGTEAAHRRITMFAVAALLVVAALFGGGGVRYGLNNLVVQLLALAILATHSGAFFGFWREAPTALRILIGLTLMIPILHVIPLPQALWTALPGRELAAQSYEIVGKSGWSAASLDQARSMVALSGLIVPLTVIAIGWSLQRHQLLLVAWVVVALGLLNFAVGIPQVTSGGTSALFYDERGAVAVLNGTFANRNSTGLLLVFALAFAAILPSPRPHPAVLPVRLLTCGLLLVAIVLTQSRTALALAALPVALGLAQAFWWSRKGKRAQTGRGNAKARIAVFAAIGLGVALLGALAVTAPGRLGDTLDRFDTQNDARAYIWDDASYTASRYWPMGSGMGTFDEVFQIDESLENTTQKRAGRAHNDYIEIAIEAGLPGLLIVAGWILLLGWLSWRVSPSPLRWVGWTSGICLLAVALQSITDYPLRNQTMLALAAFALVLLTRLAVDADREERRR